MVSGRAAYVSAGAALVFALNPRNWDNAGAPAWTPGDVIQHLKTSASMVHDLRLACVGGRRLNLRRAVYGPLRVLAPAAGAAVPAGIPFNITWTLRYNNPKFQRVKIEFSRTGTDPTLARPGTLYCPLLCWFRAWRTPRGRPRSLPRWSATQAGS
jgi:hypothetical protein